MTSRAVRARGKRRCGAATGREGRIRYARLNSALIRRVNTVKLFHALREHPGISQRRLGALAEVDAATVSIIVAQLEAAGIVQRSHARRSGRAGRPATALAIAAAGGVLVGVSVEPDVIRLLATGLDGSRRAMIEVAGSVAIDAAIAALEAGLALLIEGLAADGGAIRGIGVCLPGLVDPTGRLVFAPNLGWRDVAFGERLARLRLPVRVDNDSKAAALAEHLFGVCRGVRDFVYVNGHSGIGGGLHMSGELYRGPSGLAGELGHMKIVPEGRPCGCGGRGCFEAYASERAIRAELAAAGCHLPTLAAISAAAAAGDEVVCRVLDEAGRHLGRALANVINILSPCRVVLAGVLAELAPHLLPATRAALERDVLAAIWRQSELVVSTLGQDAVAMGGIALAMQDFLDPPRPAEGGR